MALAIPIGRPGVGQAPMISGSAEISVAQLEDVGS